MDETAFAALVDFVGGVDLNGTIFGGQRGARVSQPGEDEPEATLTSQSRLIEAMVERLPALGAAPGCEPASGLVPDHAHLSLPVSQLLGAALARCCPSIRPRSTSSLVPTRRREAMPEESKALALALCPSAAILRS